MSKQRSGQLLWRALTRRVPRAWARVLATLLVAAAVLGAWQAEAGAGARPRVLADLPATVNQIKRPEAHNSPVLAADPSEPRFVALADRLDASDFGCDLEVSGDGGRRWTPARPVRKLPAGAERCYAPEVAFDRGGRLYYLFVGLHGRTNTPMGVFLASSADRGRSFTSPRRLLGPNSFQVRMAIDPTVGSAGRLQLTWLQASGDPGLGSLPPPPNPILAAHSDDGGRSFSRPVQVSDRERELAVAPALALGPDHAVYVLYYDLGDDLRDYHGLEGPAWEGKWSLVLARSTDGGAHFRPGVVVDRGVVPPGRVMLIFTMPPATLAVDRAGRVFAAWADDRNGDWDVLMRRSSDAGRSWQRPRRLSDDRIGNDRHQYLPRLAVSPGGRLDAIFYDRRNDPRNVRNDVYYTYSSDGGQRFAPNLRLTSKSSDSRIGQTYVGPAAKGLVELGSRLALLSRDGGAVAAWTDTRNAVLPLQQDVFSTEVVLPSARRAAGRFPFVGVGLGLGALVVVALAAGVVVVLRRRAAARRPAAPAEGAG